MQMNKNKVFGLILFCALIFTNGLCMAEFPQAPLNHTLNKEMVPSTVDVVDYSGNLRRSYKNIKEVKNVAALLPLELEKVMGEEVTDFHKFFFISADETYRQDNKKLVVSSILVGGGAEEEISHYLTQRYGKPDASYEITHEFPRKWFSPGRLTIWEGNDVVVVLFNEYAHGLRSNIKIMTRDFYDSLDKESRYFKG